MHLLGMLIAAAVGAGFLGAAWLAACAILAYIYGVWTVGRMPGNEHFRNLPPEDFRRADRQVKALQLSSAAMMAVSAALGWLIAWLVRTL